MTGAFNQFWNCSAPKWSDVFRRVPASWQRVAYAPVRYSVRGFDGRLTGRGVCSFTLLPVRYTLCLQLYGAAHSEGPQAKYTAKPPPAKLKKTIGAFLPGCTPVQFASVGSLLSGLCLCKGEAKIRPDWSSPHTKCMGDYCRGLTGSSHHSTLRYYTRLYDMYG